jgi:hypothetical protein
MGGKSAVDRFQLPRTVRLPAVNEDILTHDPYDADLAWQYINWLSSVRGISRLR